MTPTFRSLIRAFLAIALTACTVARSDRAALDLGQNTAQENCSLQRSPGASAIFCGTYSEPSGQVIVVAPSAAGQEAPDPRLYLTGSAWRTGFDYRFQCNEAPAFARVLDSDGMTMTCVHRHRGYRQVVIAARVNGSLYVADGIEPAAATLPRAIEILVNPASGRLAEAEQAGLRNQRACTSLEAATVEKAAGAAAYEVISQCMTDGARKNRDGDYAGAEAAYRHALNIQEKLVGPKNPALAVPMARLALQVSNQRRFAESEREFAEARALATAKDQPDRAAPALVTHFMALDKLNQNKPAEALVLLNEADAGFKPLVQPEALEPRRHEAATARNTAEQLATIQKDTELLQDQPSNDAINGLIETHRYRAVALKMLHRPAEAEAELKSALTLYDGRDPRLTARYYRTVGMAAASAGHSDEAVAGLSDAVTWFKRAVGAGRPQGITELLLAHELVTKGDNREATSICQGAVPILRSQAAGVSPELIMPCLHALSGEASGSSSSSKQAQATMFALSQVAQGGITSNQIARATAAAASGSGSAKVRDAIQQQAAGAEELAVLYPKRAELAATNDKSVALGAVDDRIRQLEAEQHESGIALQAAAPGFAALVQESVSADATQASLGPNEALAVIVLGDDEGFTLLVRNSAIYTGRIEGGARRVDELVRRFRASMVAPSGSAPPPFDTAASYELYTAVLGPVASGLTGVTALVAAPTGSLLSVPFGALLTGPASETSAQTPFLIRQMTVSHVPSASSFVNLRRASRIVRADPDQRRPWFGFGEFRTPTLRQAAAAFPAGTCGESARALASLRPLPVSVAGLKIARELVGGSETDQLLGAQFTVDNVIEKDKGGQLAGYRILQFATHAFLPGELGCEAEPAIVTSFPAQATDAHAGLLTSTQIIGNLHLDADLVILGACNTGGPNSAGAGESLSGLARSFFYAGAKTLLVTHWDANEVVLTYLTTALLNNARTKTAGDYAAALALAQRTLLDKSVGDLSIQAHPYYWSVAAIVGGTGPNGREAF